jgi:hypothetical protein
MPERRARSSVSKGRDARFDIWAPRGENPGVRTLIGLVLVLGLAGSAGGQGLSGALDRMETRRSLQQLEMRQQTDRQTQDLQRQLDQGRLLQQIERQQTIRQAPIVCPSVNPTTIC